MPTIALPERLTMAEGRATLEALLPRLQSTKSQELDVSHLRVLDSAAIALLLACQRQAHDAGRTLRFVGAPEKLRELAQLYGVDDLLAI